MLNPLLINENDNILIISPHPDDECIGPGGVLCMYPKQCTIIVLTDGSQGQGNIDENKCIHIRKDEFISEMKAASIESYYFIEIKDGSLINNTNCLNNFDLSGFTKIFVTSNEDNHADHTAAYICLKNALFKQGLNSKDVYMYEVHSALKQPTHYLDITDCIDRKIELIKKHKSQIQIMPYDKYAFVSAQYRALQNRMSDKFIEVYYKINPYEDQDSYNYALVSELQKFKQFYYVLTNWMLIDDKLFNEYFDEIGINDCAIYGYAELGKILRKKLIKENVKVEYILDKKNSVVSDCGIPVYCPGNEMKTTDTVIVTVIQNYEEIRDELYKFGYSNVFSIREIICNMKEMKNWKI